MKRRYIIFLIFVSTIWLGNIAILTNEVSNSSSNSNSLSDAFFQVQGKSNIKTFDINHDNHADIMEINTGINVTATGQISVTKVCSDVLEFWNSANSSTHFYFSKCWSFNSTLVSLDKTGQTYLSVWIGFGYFFKGMSRQGFDSINTSLHYYFCYISSSGVCGTTFYTYSLTVYTIHNIQSYSLDNSSSGVVSPAGSAPPFASNSTPGFELPIVIIIALSIGLIRFYKRKRL